MEPSKKCTFVPTKMIHFTKGAKNMKWESSKFLITLEHNGAENTRNCMDPSKNAFFVPTKIIHFT